MICFWESISGCFGSIFLTNLGCAREGKTLLFYLCTPRNYVLQYGENCKEITVVLLNSNHFSGYGEMTGVSPGLDLLCKHNLPEMMIQVHGLTLRLHTACILLHLGNFLGAVQVDSYTVYIYIYTHIMHTLCIQYVCIYIYI